MSQTCLNCMNLGLRIEEEEIFCTEGYERISVKHGVDVIAGICPKWRANLIQALSKG